MQDGKKGIRQGFGPELVEGLSKRGMKSSWRALFWQSRAMKLYHFACPSDNELCWQELSQSRWSSLFRKTADDGAAALVTAEEENGPPTIEDIRCTIPTVNAESTPIQRHKGFDSDSFKLGAEGSATELSSHVRWQTLSPS